MKLWKFGVMKLHSLNDESICLKKRSGWWLNLLMNQIEFGQQSFDYFSPQLKLNP